MRPTRWWVLVVAAGIAGLVTYLLARVFYEDLPVLPGYGPVWLVVLAIAEVFLARSVRAKRAGRGAPLHPIFVSRLAALAKATSPVGALALGFYAGLLVYVGGRFDAAQPRHDGRVAIGGILASAALAGAALFLERSCRVRPPPEQDDDAPDLPADRLAP